MDLSTKLFGDFCVACALTAIGVVSAISLAVIVWMTVFI